LKRRRRRTDAREQDRNGDDRAIFCWVRDQRCTQTIGLDCNRCLGLCVHRNVSRRHSMLACRYRQMATAASVAKQLSPTSRHSDEAVITEMGCGSLGLKNDLWLAKRFCDRAGLIITTREVPRPQFGMAYYLVTFPDDLSRADAERLIRLVRETKVFALRRFRYHLMRDLWSRSGREMLWSRRLQSRARSKPIVR